MAKRLGRRTAYWMSHIEQARSQGLTLKAYAREHGVSLHQLYAASSTQRRTEAGDVGSVVPSGQRSGPRLLPVRVKPENGRGTIRVSLANGASIELCGDVDPLHWRALLESVVSI